MLYSLNLPPITEKCLADLVWLQMDLLDYAATTMSLPPGTKGKDLMVYLQKVCGDYLDIHGTNCRGNGKNIARNFFTGTLTTKKGRVSLLNTFAKTYHHVPNDVGTQWRERLRCEIISLFTLDRLPLRIESFYDPAEPAKMKEMQKAAAEFLLYFYESYLGSIGTTISDAFLTNNDTKSFGIQDIIDDFHDENKELKKVCVMCDESRYYTKYQGLTEKKGKGETRIKTHAILDHYFPKTDYPHLCCHPYNLVPVCYACNSSIKGTYDPLKGQRTLHKNVLPYRTMNLKQGAYLHVKPGRQTELVAIVGMFQRPGSKDPIVENMIKMLRDIYKLPDRWSEKTQTLRIVDTLFRRMRHFLGNGAGNPLGTDIEDEVYNMLKQLLYYLDVEDQQKDPFAFAMTLMLASMLKTKDSTQVGDKAAWNGLVRIFQRALNGIYMLKD